ncbi:MAG: hypothetical protein HY300_00250 [Verrucomicrobia bacterium]|nr:hypothetical protein [Verrucomicrobiota bacterium]
MKWLTFVGALIVLMLGSSCAHVYSGKLYSGPILPRNEVARVSTGDEIFIRRIDDHVVEKSGKGVNLKDVTLLPGKHTFVLYFEQIIFQQNKPAWGSFGPHGLAQGVGSSKSFTNTFQFKADSTYTIRADVLELGNAMHKQWRVEIIEENASR